ncbi:MAG: hypothetical protein EOO73_27425 [Myxococcales bacterium]|nr:MAG: hypothetical protein EOO73_27425 [Myxococcales bacterium]
MAQPAVPTLSTEGERQDPLGPVLSLGEGAVRVGAIIGLCGALLLHGAAGVRAAANLFDVESFSRNVAGYVKNNLQLQIDIDTAPSPSDRTGPSGSCLSPSVLNVGTAG